MTPEERAELERELAAEVEALDGEPDQEDGDEQEQEEKEVGTIAQPKTRPSDQHKHAHAEYDSTTWTALLASVMQCETEVFAVFRAEMEELKTRVMPTMAAAASRVEAQRLGAAAKVELPTELAPSPNPCKNLHAVGSTSAEVEARFDVASFSVESAAQPWGPQLSVMTPQSVREERQPDQLLESPASELVPSQLAALAAAVVAEPRSDLETWSEAIEVCPHVELEPSSCSVPLEPKPSTPAPTTIPATTRENAFSIVQRAQQELHAWMEAKQRDHDQEEAQRQLRAREAAQERASRSAMEWEERHMRLWTQQQRSTHERGFMADEDALAHVVEAAWARELQRQSSERQLMAQEEARMWRHIRLDRETQRKEKLVEEQSRLRRWRHRVMDELVIVLATRAEAKRKAMDAERRRAHRETSEMRSEEHGMRRLVLHERALRDGEVRQRERLLMAHEDQLARRWRDDERQQREEHECALMRDEDKRSRVWDTLWRLRMKRLKKWVGGQAMRNARLCWWTWKQRTELLVRQETDAREKLRREMAGRSIQGWFRRSLTAMRLQSAERSSIRYAETTQAAKILQSAFRGFHVRRKFLNALEMAQTMGFDSEDEFGEVNLDELIQAPPELDDDWGRPTIRSVPRGASAPDLSPEQGMSDEEEEQEEQEQEREAPGDDDDEVDDVDEEAMRSAGSRITTPHAAPCVEPQVPAEGGNLAALLWSKMRKKTHKQKLAHEERQRQQDPVYRVKKLLAKTATAATTSHTNQQTALSSTAAAASSSVTWSTNTDKKKAPKVKLPSLVERLRKKTAAAR